MMQILHHVFHENHLKKHDNYSFSLMWSYLSHMIYDNFSSTILVLHSMASGFLPEILNFKQKPKAIVLIEGNIIEADAKWSNQIRLMSDDKYFSWVEQLYRSASTIMKFQLKGKYSKDELHSFSEGFRNVDPIALRSIATEISILTCTGKIESALSIIDIPVIYLRGAESEPWSRGKLLLNKLNVSMFSIESSSHYPMIDNPNAVWRIISNI